MWLGLSAPKRCGFARLTEPQQQGPYALAHDTAHCAAGAS
jgi:hypothetical protein